MGRSRKTEESVTSNSLVASAARIGGKGIKSYSQISSKSQGWQAEAWRFYRIIGEFRYSCDWVGSMLSKALLYPTMETAGKPERVITGPAFDYVDRLFGDSDGKTEMLRLIGIHMTVAGECFIVSHANPESVYHEDLWQVVASTRLRNTGTDDAPVWHINGHPIPVQDHANNVLVVRLWRPDPEEPELAISPARAVLSVLGEIEKLTEHVTAQVNSRLAGAGILLMPSEMNFPAPPETRDAEGRVIARHANTAEDFMVILQENMGTAIEDRSDPSALVPIVVTAPGEVIDKIQHMTFWSELDSHAIDLRNEAIRRLGLGMDMPPEVLQGVSDTNHWSAWQSDESAIKSHTEPLLKMITSALAEGFLRPLLLDDPNIEGLVEHYSIRADTSEMRQRPNRSKEALELHTMGLLNDTALLRETGFDPDGDGMDDEQRKVWFLRKMASGSTTPDQVEAAFRVLFEIDLGTADPEAENTEAPSPPSLREHPVRDIPDQERSIRRKEARQRGDVPSAASLEQAGHYAREKFQDTRHEGLVAAADQLVVRALERAGNKLKSNMKIKPAFAAVDLYKTVEIEESTLEFLLDDAWPGVPRVAERYGVDTAELTEELASYTTGLLLNREDHDYDALSAHLIGTEGAAA